MLLSVRTAANHLPASSEIWTESSVSQPVPTVKPIKIVIFHLCVCFLSLDQDFSNNICMHCLYHPCTLHLSPISSCVTESFSFYSVKNTEIFAENNSGHSFDVACVRSEFIVSFLLSSLLISGHDMWQGTVNVSNNYSDLSFIITLTPQQKTRMTDTARLNNRRLRHASESELMTTYKTWKQCFSKMFSPTPKVNKRN